MDRKKRSSARRLVPLYGILPLLSCFGLNCIIYYGSRVIADPWKHYDFTTAFDRMVPLNTAWVSIYLGCYVFWIFNYILIAKQGKEHCMRFVTGEMLSRVVCGVFYVLLPTTNIRPVLETGGIWNQALAWVYMIDPATNLFPSIHCLVSWFCFVGIRGQKQVPKVYRVFSGIFAILICISTQTTKQHYFIDVVGAILIAEGMYYIGMHTNLYKKVEGFFDKVSGRIFGLEAIVGKKGCKNDK